MYQTTNSTNTIIKVILLFAVGCLIGIVLLNQKQKQEEGKPVFANSNQETELESGKMSGMRLGGTGELKDKDEEIVKVIDIIKPKFEEATGKKYTSIDVINYRTQTVAGKNYFVKVKAIDSDDKETIAHLRIFRDLKMNYELSGHQLDKELGDELVHFE